jgi:hypothetical protein
MRGRARFRAYFEVGARPRTSELWALGRRAFVFDAYGRRPHDLFTPTIRLLNCLVLILLGACSDDGGETPPPSIQEVAKEAEVTTPAPTELEAARPILSFPTQPGSTIFLDEVPPWYTGSRPWDQLPESGKRELWANRLAYEGVIAEATQPATSQNVSAVSAAAGEAVLNRVVSEYNLDPFYRSADFFGPRMVIWLPEEAWAQLPDADKAALEAFMAS